MSTNEMVWVYPREQEALEYWKNQPIDVPGTLNSFSGEWNLTSHECIPSALADFLCEVFFHKYDLRFTLIDIDEINKTLNSVWDGPGSMPKVVRATYGLRRKRHAETDVDVNSVMKDIRVPTSEEYNCY